MQLSCTSTGWQTVQYTNHPSTFYIQLFCTRTEGVAACQPFTLALYGQFRVNLPFMSLDCERNPVQTQGEHATQAGSIDSWTSLPWVNTAPQTPNKQMIRLHNYCILNCIILQKANYPASVACVSDLAACNPDWIQKGFCISSSISSLSGSNHSAFGCWLPQHYWHRLH